MRTPNPAKEEQTRVEIIAAAQKLFQTHGFDKTTVDDIAHAMGRGKGTLYYYYKSKEDLYKVVAEKEFNEVLAKVAAATSKGHSVAEKLKILFITRYIAVKEKFVLYSVMLKEHRNHLNFYNELQRATATIEMNMIKTLLIEGIEKGEFTKVSMEDCDALAMGLMMLWGGTDSEVIIYGQLPPAQLSIERTIETFIRGLK